MLKISVYDQRSRAPLKSNPASATVPIVESLNMMIGILSSCHSFYDGFDEKPLLMPWNLLISLSKSHEGITFPTLHDPGRFIGLCLIMHQDITYDNILINNHRKIPLSIVWTQNLSQPFQFDTTSWTTPEAGTRDIIHSATDVYQAAPLFFGWFAVSDLPLHVMFRIMNSKSTCAVMYQAFWIFCATCLTYNPP